MNWTKRAIRYFIRKKSKTFILFFVLFVTEAMTLSAITILHSVQKTKSDLQAKAQTKIMVEIMEEENTIPESGLEKISEISGIDSVNRMISGQVVPVDFEVVTASEESCLENQMVQIIAWDNLKTDGPFSEGKLRITSGTYPTQANEIIVNENLANINQWQIGDTVLLTGKNKSHVQAKLSGFYLAGVEREQSNKILAAYRVENIIYGFPELTKELWKDKGYERASIYLHDPEELEIKEQQIIRILGKHFSFEKSDELYSRMKRPLDQVIQIVNWMLLLSIGTAIIVITLLLCMWIRTRKQEIAIYISLGESKWSIIFQIMEETFLVFFFSTVAAIVAEYGLKKCIQDILYIGDFSTTMFIGIEVRTIAVGWMFVIGAGILIFAIGVSLIPVFTANPKDILSEMEE